MGGVRRLAGASPCDPLGTRAAARRETALERALTAREMDVMSVLWDLGSATVAEVNERLEDDLAYNTVLTILRILEAKGLAGHTKEGRAHRYHPLMGREEAGRSVLGRLRDKVFAGSAELLVAQLVSDEQLSPAAVRRLRKLLDQRLEREKGS